MTQPNLSHLAVFASVARHLSFQRAASVHSMSTSAVSHAIRGLEERLGVSLFNRTTRSVALTDAGRHFLSRLQPALSNVDDAVEAMNLYRSSPAGTVRINASRLAAHVVVAPVMARFLAAYPELSLEIINNDEMIDIVERGFDAGIRFDGTVPEDMVVVPLGPPCRFVIVATPGWVAEHGEPQTPRELQQHECIRYRFPNGRIYSWELEEDGRELPLEVPGRLVVGEQDMALRAALDGLGPAFIFETSARRYIESGALVPLLGAWCPDQPSFQLYYPRQRRISSALRAFIDVARDFHRATPGESE
jgi:DNA-binding transcriptional LysR family regulator